jgi:hypothetical protein
MGSTIFAKTESFEEVSNSKVDPFLRWPFSINPNAIDLFKVGEKYVEVTCPMALPSSMA